MATGLVVTFARGPWVGAALTVLVFLVVGPHAATRTLKALLILALACGLLLISPWASTVIDYLPFVGTIDEGTVTYRQRLAEISWMLVQQNPVFGLPGFIEYMEELRQGQGIIDLVNTYATIALSFGLVGLALFAGVFVTVIVSSLRTVRLLAATHPEVSLMGGSLLACLAGALLIIATVSNYLSIPYLYWSLAGLAAAYARFGTQVAPATVARAAWPAAMAGR